jgi:hypothetical protein
MKGGGRNPLERIAYAFRLATARVPTPDEMKVLLNSFQQFLEKYRANPEAAIELLSQGEYPRDETLDTNELASYASVASLILNLDETITKE